MSDHEGYAGRASASARLVRRHERTLPVRDDEGQILFTQPYRRPDGLWTRNVGGFDLAEIVCQSCVMDKHHLCEVENHSNMGYSLCTCNNSEVH